MEKIGIIGIGNPLRQDDGIGITLLEKLIEKKNNLPNNIEYIDGGTGFLNLLPVLSNFKKIIVIDAVNFNGKIGESKLFKLKDVENSEIYEKFSSHGTNFLQIIELYKKLNDKQTEIYFFGIQPKDISQGIALTTELEKKTDLIFEKLVKDIQKICGVSK
jgi:hydrogenase maturation protease